MPSIPLADAPNAQGNRILIVVIGSLGDLHPHIALALDLQCRGYRPVVAAFASQSAHVTCAGIESISLNEKSLPVREEMFARYLDPEKGQACIVQEVLLPLALESYETLKTAAQTEGGICMLVTSQTVLAASILVEELHIPWILTVVAPAALDFVCQTERQRGRPAMIRRIVRWLRPRVKKILRASSTEVESVTRKVRWQLGIVLPESGLRARAERTPELTLAMFSPEICPATTDWPPQVRQTGCAFYDGTPPALALRDASLERFLQSGPPPVIFTLGSAVNRVAGDFFSVSVAAAREAGVRALLLTGKGGKLPASLAQSVDMDVAVFEQIPYSTVFPRAAAVVHQGGIGTTTLAIRAGLRMLVVPFAFDQPDTAARVARLRLGYVINLREYTIPFVAGKLRELLADQEMKQRCHSIAQRLVKEDGAKAAGDVLVRYLNARPAPPRRGIVEHG